MDESVTERRKGSRVSSVEILRLTLQNKQLVDRSVWLIVRQCLDAGEDPDKIAEMTGCSRATMYRRLREEGLTYGRGHVAG